MAYLVLLECTDPKWKKQIADAKAMDQYAVYHHGQRDRDHHLCCQQLSQFRQGYLVARLFENIYGWCVRDTMNDGLRCHFEFKIFCKLDEPEQDCPKCNGVGRGSSKFTGDWECSQCVGTGSIPWYQPQVPEYLQIAMNKAWNEYWKREEEARP